MSRVPRLHVNAPLTVGLVALDRTQANYLTNVMRLKAGDAVLLFNGTEGEWRARLVGEANRPGARRAGADAAAALTTRSSLHLRAPEARPARLHGAEGGRNGGPAASFPVITRRTQGVAGRPGADAGEHRSRPRSSAASWRRAGVAGGERPLAAGAVRP